MTRIESGVRTPHNLSATAVGSIHDDATAEGLGFRAGTVAGDTHLEQFAGLCTEAFGPTWFESGWISLYFEQATAHLEPVNAWLMGDGNQREAGMATPSGDSVARGDVGVGDGTSFLSTRDRRAVAPSTLRMLRHVEIGQALDEQRRRPDGVDQRLRITHNMCTVPLDWYLGDSPWGGPICSPLTTCRVLAAGVTDSIASSCGEFVGMYGAIEIRHRQGPMMIDEEYHVTGELLAVSETPKTEVLWFTTRAIAVGTSTTVAEMTMMTRLLKESSPLYQ